MKTTLGILATLFLAARIIAGDASGIAERVIPSVVLLSVSDQSGTPLALGSGFVVADEQVATCLHVMRGGAAAYVTVAGEVQKIPVVAILAQDTRSDLVVLKTPGLRAKPIQLRSSEQLRVGNQIYAAGNPRGLEGTFTEGIVSGFREMNEVRLIQISAPISPGSSGGPVVDTNGFVVGVAVATFRDGQNLNFAVPADRLRPLLSNQTNEVKLSEFAKNQNPSSSPLFPKEDAIKDAVRGTTASWGIGQNFSFTARNSLPETVSNLRFLALAFDKAGELLDSTLLDLGSSVSVGPKLASRVSGRFNHPSVNAASVSQIELRTLDYQVIRIEFAPEENSAFEGSLKKRPELTATPSGMYYQIRKPGNTKHPTASSEISVHYRGTLIDGTEFSSSHKQGERFTALLNVTIASWREGIPLIGEGGEIKLFVPPTLGYGSKKRPGIPANSWLIYEVELFSVRP